MRGSYIITNHHKCHHCLILNKLHISILCFLNLVARILLFFLLLAVSNLQKADGGLSPKLNAFCG